MENSESDKAVAASWMAKAQSKHDARYAILGIEEGSLSDRPPLESGSCMIRLEMLSMSRLGKECSTDGSTFVRTHRGGKALSMSVMAIEVAAVV